MKTGFKLTRHSLLSGLIMDNTRMQKVCHVFCNFLEYKAAGQRPETCKTAYFTEKNIQQLLALKVESPDRHVTRVASIKTTMDKKAKYPIDIERLMKGEDISYTLPTNNTEWLIENG